MFDIEISDEAADDLQWFRKRDQVIICDGMEKHLQHEPDTETRNRKRLRRGHVAEWELRIGAFRVFYGVDRKSSAVDVARIGYKKRNKLYFRGEEFSP